MFAHFRLKSVFLGFFVAFQPGTAQISKTRLYVPTEDAFSALLAVIDPATKQVLKTIDLTAYSDPFPDPVTGQLGAKYRPYSAASSPDGMRVYVPLGPSIVVLDTTTDLVFTTIAVRESTGLYWPVVSPDAQRVYVVAVLDNQGTMAVLAIDTRTNLTVGRSVALSFAEGIVVSPDSSRLYVSHNFAGTGALWAIDARTMSVVATPPLPWSPYPGLAITPDGHTVLVGEANGLASCDVAVVDVTTFPMVLRRRVGSSPYPLGLVALSDGTAWVSSNLDHSVDRFNIAAPTGNLQFSSFTFAPGDWAGTLKLSKDEHTLYVRTSRGFGVCDVNTGAMTEINFNQGSPNINGLTFAVVEQSGDLVVSQAVDAPDINRDTTVDLVAGRPTVARIPVSAISGNDSDLVTLQSSFVDSAHQETKASLTATVAELRSNPYVFFFTPQVKGVGTVSITFPSGLRKELSVDVKPVQPFTVHYYPVNHLGLVPNYSDTVKSSTGLLQAFYPVAPTDFTEIVKSSYQPTFSSFIPRIGTCGVLSLWGACADALNLWLDAKLSTTTGGLDRVVGIVPTVWFTFNHLGTDVGINFPMVNSVVFVTDGISVATPHEIGHSFGLTDSYKLNSDGSCCADGGSSVSGGYWVRAKFPVDNAREIMSAYSPKFTWINVDNFKLLFQEFRSDSNDPEVLLVGGTIGQDGTASVSQLYRSLTGTVSESSALGDAAVQVLDAAGHILSTVPFVADFRILDTIPPQSLESAPFAFAVSYPAGAVTVQVVRQGRILTSERIASKLLRDAIASIPDGGFEKNPDQRRAVLLNDVDTFDQQLAGGQLQAARNKLSNDIRKELNDWLVNGYTTASPRQYTKSGILGLVDELLQRLGG